jgi:corrinoid protein of di/trimethylamine methyltransferase
MKETLMINKLYEEMAQSVIDGEPDIAVELANQALAEGFDPLEALNQGYIAGVNYVGKQFACGEMYLPELVGAGEAMKSALAVLEPEMTRRGSSRSILGKVVIGTVEGDIHDIGKSLVGTMLSSSGFQVYDLGVDVPIKTFVDRAREVEADIVGLSALLTTTMVKQKTIIKALDEAGLRPKVKVMVGGAPVTRGWAEEIGAEGYSEDAVGAVAVARQIMGK